MNTIFADTGFWIALLDPQDNMHQRAKTLTGSLSSAKIVTSEMVLTEVLNAFSARGEFLKRSVVTFIQGVYQNKNVDVIGQTPQIFAAALELYQQRIDKTWSHTDCASFCVMQQLHIREALAHNRHFEQAGYIALMRI
jgi:predicted nucleic acid-binding protein